MQKENLKDIYPLTPLQEGMLYHALFDKNSTAYVEQFRYRVEGPFDGEVFLQSWSDMVARFDILRTAFVYEQTDVPRQIVLKQVAAQSQFIDLCAQSPDQQDDFIKTLARKERLQPFDAAAGKLARVTVVRLSENRHEIIRTHHHILLDGWSSGLLLKDWLATYEAKIKGEEPLLSEPVSLAPYMRWLNGRDKQNSVQFWQDAIADLPALGLPMKTFSSHDKDQTFSHLRFDFGAALTLKLNQLATGCGVTLATVCRAMWGILLSRYHQVSDLMFGAIVNGRPAAVPNVDKMVGLFINAVPTPIRLTDDMTFQDLMNQLQRDGAQQVNHHHVPLVDILLPEQRFDHLFAFENFLLDDGLAEVMTMGDQGAVIRPEDRFEHTHYDFTIAFNPSETLTGELTFNTVVYKAGDMARVVTHLKTIAQQVCAQASIPLAHLDILGGQEREQVLVGFNQTAQDYDLDHSLSGKLEAYAQSTPEKNALISVEGALSYGALNQQVARLAHILVDEFGVQRHDHVVSCLPRGRNLVVAMLAIMRAGAIYVPLDPHDPPDRLDFFAKDSLAQLALVEGEHGFLDLPVLDMAQIDLNDGAVLPNRARPDDFAYMTYTSGSTGVPKGVRLKHRATMNFCCWLHDEMALGTGSVVTSFASPAFDASVFEIASALANGACLVVNETGYRQDLEQIAAFLAAHQVTHCFMPPLVAQELAQQYETRLPAEITIMVGGDVLKGIGAGRLNIYNLYGPTECTIMSNAMALKGADAQGPYPIGKPIGNATNYILDADHRPCPIGCVGELYIGGIGVAQGYWQRPELDREKFIPSPFNGNERLYRTGDLCKWDELGQVHFVGRTDDQVKVRGYRVELGEVEKHLQDIPAVDKAVVIAKRGADGANVLYAFCVGDETLNASKVKDLLRRQVPHFMIPQHIAVVDHIPLTPRGKIDRKALEGMTLQNRGSTSEKIAPRTEAERKLLLIWQHVLDRDDIGVTDNFFELGGHSLSATRVMSRIRRDFGCQISFASLFDNPVIEKLCLVIDQVTGEADEFDEPTIKRSARRG